MAAADKAIADAKKAAEEAADNKYASAADKTAINAAKAELDNKIEAANQLPKDATAEQKEAAAKAIKDAVKTLTAATNKANTNSAAAKAAAERAADTSQSAKERKLSIDSKLKVSQKGSKAVIAWGKVKGADQYIVYGGYYGKKSKKLKTVNAGAPATVNITKLNGKKINLKKNYKFYVVAYKNINGKRVKLCKTMMAYIAGRKNTKYTKKKRCLSL